MRRGGGRACGGATQEPQQPQGFVPHPSRFVPPSPTSQDFWSRAPGPQWEADQDQHVEEQEALHARITDLVQLVKDFAAQHEQQAAALKRTITGSGQSLAPARAAVPVHAAVVATSWSAPVQQFRERRVVRGDVCVLRRQVSDLRAAGGAASLPHWASTAARRSSKASSPGLRPVSRQPKVA